MRSTSIVFRALLLSLLVTACGGGAAQQASPSGPLAPQLTVERFLQLANQNDWTSMGHLFGTPRQSVLERDGPERAERHMQLLSSLLRHDDFQVSGRRSVAGNEAATRIMVDLYRNGESFTVPFVLEPRGSGWIISRIENLESLT